MGLSSSTAAALAFTAGLCRLGVEAYSATKLCPPEIPSVLQPHHRFECPAPIDEKTSLLPLSWPPWTHPPQCVSASDVPTNRLCVYTNSQHGIKGVSVITRPHLAAEATKILDEPIAPAYGFELMTNTTSGLDLPYQIVDIPGKGKGVIATRKIAKYELIMTDYASLVIDLTLPGSVQRLSGYKLLHVATDQLADPYRVKTLGRSSEHAADII